VTRLSSINNRYNNNGKEVGVCSLWCTSLLGGGGEASRDGGNNKTDSGIHGHFGS
jgi:hypothetical protein